MCKITPEKTVWLSVGSENSSSTLEAAGMSFKRVSKAEYLGSVIGDTGEPDAAINEVLLEAKKDIKLNAPSP